MSALIGTLLVSWLVGIPLPWDADPQDAAPIVAVPGTQVAVDTIQMDPKNESGIAGRLIVTTGTDSTQFEVTLAGGESGTSYPTHIHHGTCDEPGQVVAPLGTVTTGSNRMGTSRTSVANATLAAARRSGPLLVQSHLPNGQPAACGELEGDS